jgi:hypothetical protein
MDPSIPCRGLGCNKQWTHPYHAVILAKWQLANWEFGEIGNIIWRNGNWRKMGRHRSNKLHTQTKLFLYIVRFYIKKVNTHKTNSIYWQKNVGVLSETGTLCCAGNERGMLVIHPWVTRDQRLQ